MKQKYVLHFAPPYASYPNLGGFSNINDRNRLIQKCESFSGFYKTELNPCKASFHVSRRFYELRKKDLSSIILHGVIVPSGKSVILDNKTVEIELKLSPGRLVSGKIELMRNFPRKEYHLTINNF